MSDGKIVKTSTMSVERDYYNSDNQDFSYWMEHAEFGFRFPYSQKYKEDIIRITTEALPEYDLIIWRIPPEITFFKYVRPISVDFSLWDGVPYRGMPEAEFAEFHDHLTAENKPDFVRFYSRFSLGKDWKQVKLKIGVKHG